MNVHPKFTQPLRYDSMHVLLCRWSPIFEGSAVPDPLLPAIVHLGPAQVYGLTTPARIDLCLLAPKGHVQLFSL